MKVKWQISDNKRPYETEVDDIGLAACDTEEERNEFINYCIQSDFEKKIKWYRL